MPNVLNEFTGDGVTKTFTFAMTGGYLNRDYVFFFTRPNDDLLNYTPYDDANVTWVGDFTIELSAPVPIGTTFVIVRSTPLSPLVDFQNTSRITEKNLDTATQQSIHIAAESSDLVGRLEAVVQSAKADAEDALAGAQEASNNATLAAQAAMGASAAAGLAQVAAENANTAAQDALQSAQASETLASQASTEAGTATSLAQSAVAASAAANQTAGAAASTANQADSTANASSAVASEALTKASAAEVTSGNAVSTANSAVSTAEAAASDAAQAIATANEAKDLIDDAVAGGVVSFNGRVGTVLPLAGDYDKAMVGLPAVDNTSDMDKPISTAVANALSDKASTAYVNTQLAAKADKTYVDTQLAVKADKSSVEQAVAMAGTFTTVPTTFKAWVITVTHPHFRAMIWTGTKYVRAPWHAPGKLSHFLRDVPAGYVEVRSDVVLNSADFPDLAAYLGVSGETFVLDEMRGEFIRALDSGRGVDSGRAVGSWQDSANKSHSHTGSANTAGAHTHTVSGTADWAGEHTHNFTLSGSTGANIRARASGVVSAGTGDVFTVNAAGGHTHSVSGTAASAGAHTHTVTINSSGGAESRPRNRAYRLAVQY